MNVVLIRAPSDFLINDKCMPSLGILYLSAVLKKKGIDVRVIDDNDGIEDLELNQVSPDTLYGISATTPQYPNALWILNLIKEKNWKAPVVIGGPHATVKSWDLLKDGWDGIALGSGEDHILTMYDTFSKFRDHLNVWSDWDPRKNIDTIPYPDRKAIDIHSYKYDIHGFNGTTMITSRGCPYSKCAFCSQVWNSWPPVRYHSAEYVCGEIKEISMLGFNALTLFDDCWFSYKSRDKEIMNTLGNYSFVWRCIARANHVIINKDLVRHGGETGCVEVALGCESGSDRILKNINKGMTVDQNKRAIDIIREAGIKEKVNIVLGLPGEDQESLHETDKFLEEVGPDWVDISILSVYPGSDIYNDPNNLPHDRVNYDVNFDRDKYLPYKTIPGKYSCGISTSKLTSEEILQFRGYLEDKYRKRESQ